MPGDQQSSRPTTNLNQRLDVDFALQAAGLGVWELDPVTKQIIWDDRCRELYGLASGSQVSYDQFLRHIYPADLKRVEDAVQQAMNPQLGGHFDATYRTIDADGEVLRWVRFIGKVEFTDSGEPHRFAGVAQDVTEQALARQKTEESEAHLELPRDTVPAMIFYLDAEQRYQSYNGIFREWFGVKANEVIGRTVQEFIGEAAYEKTKPHLAVAYAGEQERYEMYAPSRMSAGRWLNIVYTPHKTDDGKVIGVIVHATDITPSKLAAIELANSEARFRSLIEEAPVATCLFVGREMRVEVANQLMLSFWGKGKSVFGKPLREAVPELVGQPFLDILDEVFTTGDTYETRAAPAELEVDGVPGTYYFDFIYKPLRNAAGEVYAIMDMAIDVTKQQIAQQQIEQAQQQIFTALGRLPLGLGIVVLEGEDLTIRFASPFYGQIAGRPVEEMVGKPILEARPEHKQQAFVDRIKQVMTTGEDFTGSEVPAQVLRNDQLETVYTSFVYTPQYRLDGTISGVIVIFVDVTAQIRSRQIVEQSEERYRHLSEDLDQQVQLRTEELAATNEELLALNEDLAANNEEYAAINEELEEANSLLIRSNENLQTFAYVASHDLQEPLRKIQQFGDLLRAQHGPHLGDDIDFLERMQSAASRMSTLIKDLLSFSRISTRRDTSAPTSLDDILSKVLMDLEVSIQETGAQVWIDSLPTVSGDASQLGQLFQNLLSIALKFRREGVVPQISVSSNLVAASDLPAAVKPARQARHYYRINVADNGIGFDEKYLDRIFQVFQRLHGRNQFAGTGIGLSICEKVVTNHGGAITATSQEGQGSTFSVYLPL